MVTFVATLIVLLSITIIIQLISKMKIVGGNELGIVSGRMGKRNFSTISGGRVFIIPLLNRFAKIDLTPQTIEVVVDSAIAAGIIPLTVKATVSFAISSSESGRNRAVTRILSLTQDWNELCDMASSIIEGHLRDAIASMTPEQVMQDKDTLVSKMINVCKSDLENIGLEITTMNIADVDDHRLPGVETPDLYIALLKRVQTAEAAAQAREARATTMATSVEQQEQRRGDVEVRRLENALDNLKAQTKVRVAEENQRKAVGVEQAIRDSKAQVVGLQSQIEAEKERIEMLKKKYEAEVVTPAIAEKEKNILNAKARAAEFLGTAQGEIDQLKETIDILNKGEKARQAYIIENFNRIIGPFAETMNLFPVDKVSVITGADNSSGPISAIHPNAVDAERNRLIAEAMGGAVSQVTEPAQPAPRKKQQRSSKKREE